MPTVPDDVREQIARATLGRCVAEIVLGTLTALPADSRLALSRALCPEDYAVVPREPTTMDKILDEQLRQAIADGRASEQA